MELVGRMLRKVGLIGPRFKVEDMVRKPTSAISVGYTGRVRNVHDHGGRFRPDHVYEIVPDSPVAGSRHPLIAQDHELEKS